MGGGSRPGYTTKVKLVGLDATILTLQISEDDAKELQEYFKENGNDYVAQFSPVAPEHHPGGTGS
jgi:hypothetical protein